MGRKRTKVKLADIYTFHLVFHELRLLRVARL